MKRPLSLTIVGWFLIVTSVISLISFPTTFSNPLTRQILAQSPWPIEAHMAIGVVNLLLSFVSGIGILKGKNWARLLYVGGGLVGLIVGLLSSPLKSMLLLGLLVLLVIAFFLFRKPANLYFGKSYFGADAHGPTNP